MSSKLAVFIVTHTQCIQGLNHITLCYLDWRPVSLVFRLDVHCLTLIIWLLLYTSAVCCRKKWILTTTEFHLFNSINWLGIFSVVHRQNHVPWWFLDRTMCPDGSSTEPCALMVPQQNHTPWSWLSLWKWVPGISPGVKAAGVYGWWPTTLVVPKRQENPGL